MTEKAILSLYRQTLYPTQVLWALYVLDWSVSIHGRAVKTKNLSMSLPFPWTRVSPIVSGACAPAATPVPIRAHPKIQIFGNNGERGGGRAEEQTDLQWSLLTLCKTRRLPDHRRTVNPKSSQRRPCFHQEFRQNFQRCKQ